MQVEDSLGNRSRWDAQAFVLEEAATEFASLSDDWSVLAYSFAESLEPIQVDQPSELAGAVGKLAPDGEESALGAALEELLEREGDERLRGVFIFSDGAQRAVPPNDIAPQLIARQYAAESIPLFPFCFGQPGSADRSDLSIEDLLVSGTVFAEAPMQVTGQLRAEGYANRNAKVQTALGRCKTARWTAVDTKEQSIVGDSSRTPLLLTHTPTTPGEHKLTLKVESPEGELILTNNESSTFVTVREGGIKLLYLIGATRIGGGPGNETGCCSPHARRIARHFGDSPVAQLLAAAGRLARRVAAGQLRCGVAGQRRQPGAQRRKLGSSRGNGSSGNRLDDGWRLSQFRPGRGFRTNPLARVLPVEIGFAEEQRFREPIRQDVHIAGPIQMEPTQPIGAAHPIMQLSSRGSAVEMWGELPALDGANLLPQRRVKQNAQVLAQTADASRRPLLVAGQSGEGRTLAFAADSTWRWRMENHGDEHRRFWRQVVLWLAKKDDKPEGQVWIDLATRRVPRGGRLDVEIGGRAGRRGFRSGNYVRGECPATGRRCS